MAKKKNGKAAEPSSGASSSSTTAAAPPAKAVARVVPAPGPSIRRNKRWQHLAAFDGAWLQMTPEHIMSSATINHKGYRPLFLDDAVFYDLVRIRSLVDDAAELALRAASDTPGPGNGGAASSTTNAHSMLRLGLPDTSGNGRGVRLSAERRHRIRLEAVQKLSQAFEIDEIAAGVAAMQSVSTVEDLAARVLQRSPNDRHALYLHFFHEKLASNQTLASARPDQLDRILADYPDAVPILRTRATAHLLRGDHDSALADLTEALRLTRLVAASAQRRECAQFAALGKSREAEAASMAAAGLLMGRKKGKGADHADGRMTSGLEPHQMLSSMEPQLLFRRASVYLAMACELVHDILGPAPDPKPKSKSKSKSKPKPANGADVGADIGSGSVEATATDTAVDPAQLEEAARQDERRRSKVQKKMRVFAKRAVRDFLAFMGHLDYSPNLPIEFAENFTRRLVESSTSRNGVRSQDWARGNGVRRLNAYNALLKTHVAARVAAGDEPGAPLPDLQIEAHAVRDLFTDTDLAARLPPYPTQHEPSETPVNASGSSDDNDEPAPETMSLISLMMAPLPAKAPVYITHEVVTFHPLLEDALHGLLLAHCLLDTPAETMVQHANTVARLTRFADGYPVFQRAPSPARMDWSDVLRAVDSPDWIGLPVSWDDYCRQFVLSPKKKKEYDALSGGAYPADAGETIRTAVEYLSMGSANAAGTAAAARALQAAEAAEAAEAALAARAAQAAGKPLPPKKPANQLRTPQAPRGPPPPHNLSGRAATIVRWLRDGGPRKQQDVDAGAGAGAGADADVGADAKVPTAPPTNGSASSAKAM